MQRDDRRPLGAVAKWTIAGIACSILAVVAVWIQSGKQSVANSALRNEQIDSAIARAGRFYEHEASSFWRAKAQERTNDTVRQITRALTAKERSKLQ